MTGHHEVHEAPLGPSPVAQRLRSQRSGGQGCKHGKVLVGWQGGGWVGGVA